MISPAALNTLASGLSVQAKVAETSAVNVVNAQTPDYQAQRGQVVSRPLQGADYVPLPPEGGVDLVSEMVRLSQAGLGYKAAAKAFSSIDQVEKRVLDALA